MSNERNLLPAASALLGEAEDDHQELLRRVVTTACALFGAAAATVFLLDEQRGELVFEAVSGEGESYMVGRRFPASRGIAGWVLSAHEPLVVADLATSPVFAKDLAETTGYVPRSLMAAPLLYGEEAVGVMEVLDPAPAPADPLAAGNLLALLADRPPSPEGNSAQPQRPPAARPGLGGNDQHGCGGQPARRTRRRSPRRRVELVRFGAPAAFPARMKHRR